MRAEKMIKCGGATTGALEARRLAGPNLWQSIVRMRRIVERRQKLGGRSTSGQSFELRADAVGEASRSALVDDFDAVLQYWIRSVKRHLGPIALGHARNTLTLGQVTNDERMVGSQRIDREGRPRHRAIALEHAVGG